MSGSENIRMKGSIPILRSVDEEKRKRILH